MHDQSEANNGGHGAPPHPTQLQGKINGRTSTAYTRSWATLASRSARLLHTLGTPSISVLVISRDINTKNGLNDFHLGGPIERNVPHKSWCLQASSASEHLCLNAVWNRRRQETQQVRTGSSASANPKIQPMAVYSRNRICYVQFANKSCCCNLDGKVTNDLR